jgi:hypothetical protein
MKNILSFDVGMKNLAYCLFQVSDDANNTSDYKVLQWEVINLCTPIVKKCNNGGLNNCGENAKYCKTIKIAHNEDGENDDLVMTLVVFAWVATQKYFKEIVSHDIRKQIQLENMNQLDEEVLPAPIIEDGRQHNFEVMDGDLWEVADGNEIYSGFIRDSLKNL